MDNGLPQPDAAANLRLRSVPFVSVGQKLAGATIALLSVVTVCVYLQLSRHQRENLLGAKEAAALAVTRFFVDSCTAPVVFDDAAAIDETLTTLGRNDEVDYAVVWSVDAAGQKVARRLGELRRGRAELVKEVPPAMHLTRGTDRVVLVSPVVDRAGKRVAVVLVAFSLARENRDIAQVRRTTLIVSAGVAIGLMILLMVITRIAIVGPLGKLVAAAKDLEAGGGGAVDLRTNDEVGQLAGAFRSMATAIRVREKHIRVRNADMQLVLDNVGQGFVTLDVKGKMSAERSRVVDEWFGPAGVAANFWDYLGTFDSSAGEWFELGWSTLQDHALPLALCLDQLPAVIRKDGKTFELAYRPIMDGDDEWPEKVIVVITDVTARLARESAEQAQREMMSIFQRMLADRTAFDEAFAELAALVDGITGSDGTDLILLRRQVHTLKGNCAIYGIESVGELCHELEDHLQGSSDPLGAADRTALRAVWTKVERMHGQLTGTTARPRIEIDPAEHRAFLEDVRGQVGRDVLAATTASWLFEPASKRLLSAAAPIRDFARRLGKTDVALDIVCEPPHLRLPPRRWAPFWAAFTHVARNIADHGIETAEERLAAGKPVRAGVTLALTRGRHELVITVADDGRGIDWGKIATRAKTMGLPHATPADLEEALFAEGVSSRATVTSTSGRGVGLGALRAAVRELGGQIEIRSESGRGTTLRFVFPESLLRDDAAGSQGDEAGVRMAVTTVRTPLSTKPAA